jgi:phosphatidylglycerophosphatase A
MRASPIIFALGSLFGAGAVPRIPGTIGSVVAAGAVLALGLGPMAGAPWWWLLVVAAGLLVLGIVVGNAAARQSHNSDPQWFVLDEACGVTLALVGQFALWPDLSPWVVTAVFLVLFRAFDILKPPPVRQLESLPGGAGIMLDDVAAGVLAWVCGSLLLLAATMIMA